MSKFIFELDESSAKVLAGKRNKSQIVRSALALYQNDITTDSIQGLREAFKQIKVEQHTIDTKLALLSDLTTKIASKLLVSYNPDEFNDWGA